MLHVSHCCLIINGSCSIMQDTADIKTESKIYLAQVVVKASMSTETLIALLKPLEIGQMHLQDCTILDENKENNTSSTKQRV